MSKERYNQIIDEAYENYFLERSALRGPFGVSCLILSKEQFITECKTNPELSDKWGLKIEERKLSIDEREDIFRKQINLLQHMLFSIHGEEGLHGEYDKQNVPRKLITLTYNNEIIESYE